MAVILLNQSTRLLKMFSAPLKEVDIVNVAIFNVNVSGPASGCIHYSGNIQLRCYMPNPVVWAAVSLAISTAGAGILSFPQAAAYGGVPVLVVSCIVLSAVAALCDLILAEEIYRHRHTLSVGTFDELVWRSLGKKQYFAAACQIMIGLTGAIVCFLCVTADLVTPVVVNACGDTFSTACSIFTRREAIILAFSIVVALPLAGCSRIHDLRGTSALAVAAVAAVGVLVVIRAVDAPTYAGGDAPIPRVQQGGLQGCILALPIVVYAMGNHVQSVPVYFELADSARRRYHWSVTLCFVTVSMMYLATGIAGYAAFGAATRGNILSNFPLGDASAAAAKILMGAHVMLVVPVDVIPARRCLVLLLRLLKESRRRQRQLRRPAAALSVTHSQVWKPAEGTSNMSEDLLHGMRGAEVDGGHGDNAMESVYDEHAALATLAAEDAAAETQLLRVCGSPCSTTIAVQTTCIVLGAAATACLFPSVTVAFGLLGATTSVTLMISYPAFMLTARAADQERAATAGVDDSAFMELRFGTPRSPSGLRALAWALHALSAVLIILGTSTYVYTTWIMA